MARASPHRTSQGVSNGHIAFAAFALSPHRAAQGPPSCPISPATAGRFNKIRAVYMTTLDRRDFMAAPAVSIATPTALGPKECNGLDTMSLEGAEPRIRRARTWSCLDNARKKPKAGPQPRGRCAGSVRITWTWSMETERATGELISCQWSEAAMLRSHQRQNNQARLGACCYRFWRSTIPRA
jgi:hypothetical protein